MQVQITLQVNNNFNNNVQLVYTAQVTGKKVNTSMLNNVTCYVLNNGICVQTAQVFNEWPYGANAANFAVAQKQLALVASAYCQQLQHFSNNEQLLTTLQQMAGDAI